MNTPAVPCRLSISIVTYLPDLAILEATLRTLIAATHRVATDGLLSSVTLTLVDNSPADASPPVRELLATTTGGASGLETRFVNGQGNVGFGRAHNLAFQQGMGDFHLILNPDVELALDALSQALAFMEQHPECGLLCPASQTAAGAEQFPCKRYPSVLDLLLRGFAPRKLRRLFDRRLSEYEMRDLIHRDETFWDPPIISGSCMLFRASVLKATDGFDPGYFLYFEDFDLSLRAARVSRIAYVPTARILHHGGHAARKGWRHIAMFSRSGLRFFRSHGWKFW